MTPDSNAEPANKPALNASGVRWMRLAMALVYAWFGFLHLRAPEGFVPIVPPFLPFGWEIVVLTGVLEILGAIGLLTRRFRRSAGIALALYAVCVFPANIWHAISGVQVGGLPTGWIYHAPRLALQPVLVWWALFCSGVIDWPRRETPLAPR